MKRCVFFDRDGIVNESPGAGYVERWADFHLLPSFVDVLRRVHDRGYAAVVVTNQRGVARGLLSIQDVDDMHDRLRKLLSQKYGLELDDILCCPHEEGACECRKPRPGMLTLAAQRHGLDLAASWMIGDQETDVEAGRRAGCRTIRVGGTPGATAADHQVPDMEALVALIEKVL